MRAGGKSLPFIAALVVYQSLCHDATTGIPRANYQYFLHLLPLSFIYILLRPWQQSWNISQAFHELCAVKELSRRCNFLLPYQIN